MLIGGVAVVARGVRRLTDDVDATLWAPDIELDALFQALERDGFRPRIPDAAAFARQSQVVLIRHEPSGVDIDLSLAWLPFEDDALKRATEVRLGKVRVPVASPDDLIVYKAIAARERDRSDIERLLAIHGAEVDRERVVALVRDLAGALERPELLVQLEALLRMHQPKAPKPRTGRTAHLRRKR